MNNERFEALVEELRNASFETLLRKSAGYSNSGDRLHNFRIGAAIIGGTPAQAAMGYMAKHLASLQDKVATNDFHNREDLLEKCQDIINYIAFIWCCGNEEMEKYVHSGDAKKCEECTTPSEAYTRMKADFEAHVAAQKDKSCFWHGGAE